MPKSLPQPGQLFLTDAGLETDMVYNRGLELPCFSSTTLLRHDAGQAALDSYFRDFLELARKSGTGCILESASWRASPDWAEPLGIAPEELHALIRRSVVGLRELAAEYPDVEFLVSGCVGPRGDGYEAGDAMSIDQAEAYHGSQVRILADAAADLVTAITMTNSAEAAGIVRAAKASAIPVVISFTVETDGTLPSGETLADAIATVDEASAAYPAYYMINCAHPDHFEDILDPEASWTARIGGLRANASRCSHAELDRMTELDAGDPAELADQYRALRSRLPNLRVLGGCCGTDIRHVTAIAEACVPIDA